MTQDVNLTVPSARGVYTTPEELVKKQQALLTSVSYLRYLLRDRDNVYDTTFRRRVHSLGIVEVLTAPRSPWQNPYVERLIGSVRRDCLNHVIVLNERHLKRLLQSCFSYYHAVRTHLALDKQSPEPR